MNYFNFAISAEAKVVPLSLQLTENTVKHNVQVNKDRTSGFMWEGDYAVQTIIKKEVLQSVKVLGP
jgi:hypothetical protein